MTKLLDQAIEVARRLPPEDQDNIARALIQLAGAADAGGPITLSADERAAIERSKAAAVRGEFASEQDVQAIWAKHRR